jgi:hypothetical protein
LPRYVGGSSSVRAFSARISARLASGACRDSLDLFQQARVQLADRIPVREGAPLRLVPADVAKREQMRVVRDRAFDPPACLLAVHAAALERACRKLLRSGTCLRSWFCAFLHRVAGFAPRDHSAVQRDGSGVAHLAQVAAASVETLPKSQ